MATELSTLMRFKLVVLHQAFYDDDVLRAWMNLEIESEDDIGKSLAFIRQHRPALYQKIEERWNAAFK